MTVTDTDAPSTVTSDAPALAPPRPATGFAALIGTGEHLRIGRLWIATSFLFLMVSAIAGVLVGVERIDTSGIDVLEADTVVQLVNLYPVAGVFLFLVPLLLGLAIAVVPAQIGSPSLAFPRAAAAAYWTYLVSGGIVLAAFIADGGPGGADTDAVALYLAGMIMVLASLSLAAVCVATTVLALRAPGMSLRRAPLFAWSNLLAASVWLLTLPVLAGILILAYVDTRYGPTFIGSGPSLHLRMAWVWSQPAVYAFAIPVLGIIGDVVPVAARTRLTQHRVAMGAIGGFAVFSFGAWALPSFPTSLDGEILRVYADEIPFIAFSILIVVPLLAFAGLLADTVRRGKIQLISPLAWSAAALLMLLAGALNGALVSIEPFDLINTTAETSMSHYVLAATMLGLFGGLAYWAPVLYGRAFPDGPSTALALGGLLGTVVLCLPDLISGFLGQLSLLGGADDNVDAIETLNVVSLVGGGLLGLVAVGFLLLLVGTAAKRGGEVVADPWDGHTLEWSSGEELVAISSEAPVYDARHRPEEDA